MTGLTEISDVIGYELAEGKKIPCDGELYYQGYNVMDLVDSISDRRFGFEETTYLLLFGQLPNKQQLLDLKKSLQAYRNCSDSSSGMLL